LKIPQSVTRNRCAKDRQWPKDKGQKEKHRSTKRYTYNKPQIEQHEPTTNGCELMCSGSVSSSCSINDTSVLFLVKSGDII